MEGSDGGVLLPPELIRDSPAKYPEALRGSDIGGDVQLAVDVDEEGAVSQARLLSGANPLMNRAGLEAAAGLQFRPATLNGTPIAVEIFYTYHFRPQQSVPAAASPRATLQGLVRTRGSRKPIGGAHLAADTGESTDTDGAGRFALALAPGRHAIAVNAAQHRGNTFTEVLEDGQTLEVVYGLTPGRVNPYETVVRADRDRAEVSRITLSGAELREIPGTLGDPFRVVMLLPGVGSVVSGLAYPVVRGAEPAATGYYLDTIEVPILFHLLLGPAVVYPDFIDRIDFYPGAPPPEYGRNIGGVVEGTVARTRDDRVHASAYVDFINTGAFVEIPIRSTGTDITGAGRFSYTPLLISLVGNINAQASSLVLNFYDYQLRVEQKLAAGVLRLLLFGSSDEAGTRGSGPPGFAQQDQIQTVSFLRLDLRYRHPIWDGEGEVGVTYGTQQIGQQNTQRTFALGETAIGARGRFRKDLSPRWLLRTGVDADYRFSQTITQGIMLDGSPLQVVAPQAQGSFSGAWAELGYRPAPGWLISPGLRLDNYWLFPDVHAVAVEPRLSARKELTPTLALKGGVGLYHQPATALITLPAIELSQLGHGLQEAIQIDVGAEWTFWRDFELQVDLYLNLLTRTVDFDYSALAPNGSPTTSPGAVVVSHGYAFGADFLLRRRLGGNWFGWIAYSLSRSVRSTVFPRYDANGHVIGTGSADLPTPFDQTQILNLVVSYQLPAHWTVGAVAHFNSGRPEIGLPFTSSPQRPGVDEFGMPRWVPVSLDQAGRLPDFFRIDLRVSKLWILDVYTLELYLDFLNASISTEVLSYDYYIRSNGQLVRSGLGVPVLLPFLGLKATY
jgi:TonB family protein